jgi:hypothetical protein
MMHTGYAYRGPGHTKGRRFYVDAKDAEDAKAKVRQAEAIRNGNTSANQLVFEGVVAYSHIAWA